MTNIPRLGKDYTWPLFQVIVASTTNGRGQPDPLVNDLLLTND